MKKLLLVALLFASPAFGQVLEDPDEPTDVTPPPPILCGYADNGGHVGQVAWCNPVSDPACYQPCGDPRNAAYFWYTHHYHCEKDRDQYKALYEAYRDWGLWLLSLL